MLQKVKQWLSNPKRDYRFGLETFNKYASPEIKAKFSAFFELKEDEEEVKPFDPRFPVLINKVSAIHTKMQINPEAYGAVTSEPTLFRKKFVQEVTKIKTLMDEKAELEDEIDELRESDEEKQDEIDTLTEQLEEKDEQIKTLGTQLQEKADSADVKIVTFEDLPKDLKPKYERTKIIVPLMAKLHAELSNTQLTDEERAKIAKELCELDDERRTIWDAIDTWADGKKSILDETTEIEYSEDPLVKGMQIANRIKRVKENMKRSEDAIAKHAKANKPNLEATARERLAAYQAELNELEKMVNAEK